MDMTSEVEGLRVSPHRRAQPKIIQVAVPKALLERMEAHRASASIPVTKTSWILTAIAERLDRLDAEAREKNAR